MNNDTNASVHATAGGMLRAARSAKGLHIAALAAALKVTPAKLEALESDRVSELPDATFARALAQAVCRHLGVESGPVLALMPAPPTGALRDIHQGINTPYREVTGGRATWAQRFFGGPWTWASLGLVAAAGGVMLLPSGYLASLMSSNAAPSFPAASSASSPSVVSVVAPTDLPANAASGAALSSAPAASTTAASLAASASAFKPDLPPTASGPLSTASAAMMAGELPEAVVRTSEATWIEAVDANGKVLMARTVPPGELLSLQGLRPLRLRIGNAAGVELLDHGKAVDLRPATRENVARIELK